MKILGVREVCLPAAGRRLLVGIDISRCCASAILLPG
jgi:hypothetical protein